MLIKSFQKLSLIEKEHDIPHTYWHNISRATYWQHISRELIDITSRGGINSSWAQPLFCLYSAAADILEGLYAAAADILCVIYKP